MNDFQAKYIKISADYLQEKLDQINHTQNSIKEIESKQELSFKNLVSKLFKKPTKD